RRYGLDLDKECLTETPKDDEFFSRASNVLALSNATALNAMKEKAAELGYSAVIQNSCLTGEASEVGPALAADIDSAAPGTVILYCGETTVTIDGKGGKGGRNQQVALSALPHVKRGRLVISLASDGRDNGPHAGAIADAAVLEAARSKKLDPADFAVRNDSSTFFEAIGDGLIETGDTGSNVSDLLMAIVSK
ncbi:MAG: glycerate kinase, partial [Patescibacteria group bacterium]|nr:glycerate kinase [Patescibacteria group bacterium]